MSLKRADLEAVISKLFKVKTEISIPDIAKAAIACAEKAMQEE